MSDIIQQWLTYATKLAQQGRIDEALTALNRVVEEDQQNLDVRNAIIKFASQKGDYATVIYQHISLDKLFMGCDDDIVPCQEWEVVEQHLLHFGRQGLVV